MKLPVTSECHFYSVTNIDVVAMSLSSQTQHVPCRVYETCFGYTSAPRFTKRYENMLGQGIKEERSGFKGAVLATVHSYDSFGRLVSTVADYEPTTEYTYDILGNRIAVTRNADNQWRKSETLTAFMLDDANIWLTQTNIVSCSDTAIAPLVSSSARQLTGLTVALPSRSRSIDVRGNATVNELLVDSPFVTSRQTVPYATNKPQSILRYGVELQTVSVSAVTNTVAYDPLGRAIAHTDGRGNTTHTEYNAFGQRSASIDALGNRTTYAYDQFGNLASVTDPLGHATVYEYDLRGRKTYEGGATYPVRYTYDVFGNKTTMITYRDESKGHSSGDVTTWLYDEASGVMTNKVYADGKGPKYDYTPDGKLAKRTWARGITTDYSYDNWGNLTNTVYSDNTPTISLSYDALGRKIEARDVAGATTFLYDSFGSLTNETVVGVAGTNTIERYWDGYGRTIGYALNGARQTTIGYEPDKGRIATMEIADNHSTTTINLYNYFRWTYLSGSDLKSSLAYPNGLTASWQYDANNQLLQVRNAMPTNVISQYDYTYDLTGRRIAIGRSGSAMSETRTDEYGYNIRGELISVAKNAEGAKVIEYQYAYDDIGNRITSLDLSTNRFYTANNLNQYTSISNFCGSLPSVALAEEGAAEFTPQFDDDGNQTLIQTATGIWQVQYNGENRPVVWQSVSTNSPIHNSSTPPIITMSYDRMGRRVIKNNQRFVYNGYLQIANFDSSATNSQLTTHNSQFFIWDPTEPIATRPLVWRHGDSVLYYAHDGNKSISEVVSDENEISAHYDYAPFGAIYRKSGGFAADNPWHFSSEYSDDDISTLYYNYRNYDFYIGRMLSRDVLSFLPSIVNYPLTDHSWLIANLYRFVSNCPVCYYDYLGREEKKIGRTEVDKPWWMSNWLIWPKIIPNPKDVYGQYCGACRINGKFFDGDGQCGWKSNEIGAGKTYYYYDAKTGEKMIDTGPEPDDDFDRCCMNHDICLADVEYMIASPIEKSKQTKICDEKLALCWIKAFFGFNFALEARIKVSSATPVMAIIAHSSDTAAIVSSAVGEGVDALGDVSKEAREFFLEGMKNAMEDAQNENCNGGCLFSWSF